MKPPLPIWRVRYTTMTGGERWQRVRAADERAAGSYLRRSTVDLNEVLSVTQVSG